MAEEACNVFSAKKEICSVICRIYVHAQLSLHSDTVPVCGDDYSCACVGVTSSRDGQRLAPRRGL